MDIFKSTVVPYVINKEFSPPYGALHAFNDFNLSGATLVVAPYYTGSKFAEWDWLVSESKRNDEIVKSWDVHNAAGPRASSMAGYTSGWNVEPDEECWDEDDRAGSLALTSAGPASRASSRDHGANSLSANQDGWGAFPWCAVGGPDSSPSAPAIGSPSLETAEPPTEGSVVCDASAASTHPDGVLLSERVFGSEVNTSSAVTATDKAAFTEELRDGSSDARETVTAVLKQQETLAASSLASHSHEPL